MRQKQNACMIVVAVAMASLIFNVANSSYAQNEKYRGKLDGNNEIRPVRRY